MPEIVNTESPVIQAPPIPYWLEGILPTPDYQIKFLTPKGELVWESNVGPQTWFLLCPYDEILYGGARGGGKSCGLIAWMAMGDPSLPEDDPARHSFLNDPSFRGLLLREEYQSMAEFVEQSVEFYRNFGGKPTGNPVVIDFTPKGQKHGAKIYFNHLGDEESYNKYRGWNITKIGIEELKQIPTLHRYLKLLGSLRSVDRIRNGKRYPKLRTQLAASANPDGPGIWVKERFVDVRDSQGDRIPWNSCMWDRYTKLTRIFIPAKITDNPYLRDDKKYMGMLLAQNEVTQQQWIYGDWDAGSGVFFTEYRPDGPRGQEEQDKYPWARHLIDPVPLKPWWYRWGGGDWGYDHPAVFHKACRNESDHRIHIYDELRVRHVGSYELGVLLAKWWMPDLEGLPDHQITIYLSPDAFSKTDVTKTKAEQIAMGIQEVLGPYGAFLLRYNDDERAAAMRNPQAARALFERRRAETHGKMCITLKPANTDRVAGASYIRELLRFRPILQETEDQIKARLESIFAKSGIEAYERELQQYRKLTQPEALPKLQIWKGCHGLNRCLKEAQHDEGIRAEDVRKWDAEDGVGGDDPYDSARHLAVAYKEIETTIPKSYWVNQRVEEFQNQTVANFGQQITDVTRLMQIQRTQEALYDKTNQPRGGTWTPPRAASMRHQPQRVM